MGTPSEAALARLRPAPRLVSRGLTFCLCTGFLAQLGFLVVMFSTIFVFAFRVPQLVGDLLWPARGSVPLLGTVIDVSDEPLRINKEQVHRVSFQWEEQGKRFVGESYVTGEVRYGRGARVELLVAPGHPEDAVIQGMRRTAAPVGLVVIALFPLAGLALVGGNVALGLSRARLLRVGELARARLVKHRRIEQPLQSYSRHRRRRLANELPVFELTFRYVVKSGESYETVVKNTDTSDLTDDREEPVLYDPRAPYRARLLGELPGDPRPDEDGNFTGHGSITLRLLVPALALAAWLLGFAACT